MPNECGVKGLLFHVLLFPNDSFRKGCHRYHKPLRFLKPGSHVGVLELHEVPIVSFLTGVVETPIEPPVLRGNASRFYPLFVEESTNAAVFA